MYCLKSVLFSVEIQSSVFKITTILFYTANYLANNFSESFYPSKSKFERLIFVVLMKIYLQ